jgi:zinc carboxypeptidase/PA domain-containing protein
MGRTPTAVVSHPTSRRAVRRRARSSIVVTAGVVLAVLAPPVAAPVQAQSSEANCDDLDDPSDSGWTSHAQLGEKLARIEATSQGRVEVDVIGHSHRGREIYAARVGTGDRVLLVTSEIHGNEKTGTEALLQLLRTLGSSGTPQAQAIREGVTIVAVPKFNPDGAELNRRQNDFPWTDVMAKFGLAATPRAFYYSNGAAGFDVNRDFNADLTYEPQQADLPGAEELPGFYLTNEARALRALYIDLRAEFGEVDAYVDLHHRDGCDQINEARPNLVTIDAPSSAAGTYEAAGASFGPDPTRQGLDGDIALVNDGSTNPTEGCSALIGFPAGAIALVDRGPTCSFVQKVRNAQAAGAVAVIVANDRVGLPTNLNGNAPDVTIPAVHVAQDVGDAIKAGLPATGQIAEDLGQYATAALDFPPLGSDVDGNPRYADWPLLDQDKSRRYALAAALGMKEHAGKENADPSPFFGGVVRYIHQQISDGYTFDRDFAGQARSAFALNGTGTVLFEIRGQSDAWGQKQMGQLTQIVEAGVLGIAERMADGSIDTLDGDLFYELPKYW